MIERALVTVRALSALAPGTLDTTEGTTLAGDCADALRLELDCPQQELTATQRRLLTRLSDLLEAGTAHESDIRATAQQALSALAAGPTNVW